MRTKSSIDLTTATDPCFGLKKVAGNRRTCKIMCKMSPECGVECAFYKPESCEDWVRVEDEEGINLIPQEEYYPARAAAVQKAAPASWKITRVRT